MASAVFSIFAAPSEKGFACILRRPGSADLTIDQFPTPEQANEAVDKAGRQAVQVLMGFVPKGVSFNVRGFTKPAGKRLPQPVR